MAAISGVIKTTGGLENLEAIKSAMTKSLQGYKIDKINTQTNPEFVFVSGEQYFTKEDHYSISPYYDEKRQIVFATDCMIDNREELIPLVKENLVTDMSEFFKEDVADSMSDSFKKACEKISDQELIYAAYLSFGPDFPKKVLGIFSFAVYHLDSKEFYLYTDHTSTRTIHYALDGDYIYFGTLLNSIKAATKETTKKSYKLNEEWISLASALANPDMIYKVNLSAYEGIYTVEAGHYIFIKNGKIKSHSYYNPAKEAKENKLKYKSDKDWREAFVSTLNTCVKSVLRSEKNTGCTLSSGLDSSSIACLALKELKKEDKKLYSYTSVPLKDYLASADSDKYAIDDESFGPKIIKKYYDNLEPNFVDCKGKTAFSDLENTIKLTELPHKSLVNYTWISEIYELASANDCKVMLKGQYGNSTISNGKILSRVYQDLRKCKFVTALKEAKAFCNYRKVSKKYFLKTFLKTFMNKFFLDISAIDEHFLRADLIEKYKIKQLIKENFTREGGSYMDSRKQFERYVYDTRILQHLGLFDTRLSLIYGLVIRDPAKDKRIIDFCFRADTSCFVKNGVERRMVRDYMRGIVPDEILDIVNRRGLQSSDYAYRVNQVWKHELKSKVLSSLGNPFLLEYFDKEKIENFKKELEAKEQINSDQIQETLCLVSLSEFGNLVNQQSFQPHK